MVGVRREEGESLDKDSGQDRLKVQPSCVNTGRWEESYIRRLSSSFTMTSGTQQILAELKAIRAELRTLAARPVGSVDVDLVLTDHDRRAIERADEAFRRGKTKRLI